MSKQTLPSLPVPSLEDTQERYLAALRPLLTEEKYEEAKRVVDDFFSSDTAQMLQGALEQRAGSMGNWLEEWWEQAAYLVPRYSIAITINPAACFLLPPSPQLQRAAYILHATAEYFLLLQKGELPSEKLMGQPLCMYQYTRLFGSWREPGEGGDSLHSTEKPPKHVIVVYNGHYFRLDIISSDGTTPRSIESVFMSLKEIMGTCKRVFDPLGRGPSVGALTSADDRDEWAKLKNELRDQAVNKATLSEVDASICVLVLERDSPEEPVEVFKSSISGDAGDRYFDKFTYTVFNNGLCGGNGEHSQADAIVAVICWDWVCERVSLRELRAGEDLVTSVERGGITPAPYRMLRWHITPSMAAVVDQYRATFAKRANDIDAEILMYKTYGRKLLKWCRLAPDAFVQQAIQLAFAREYGDTAVATYESAHTRLFHHGRTETIRSCSSASKDWIEAMIENGDRIREDKNVQDMLRSKLLASLKHHTQLTVQALQGQGIDRHLLGMQLMLMMAPEGTFPKDAMKMFSHESYSKSGGGGNYVLSTSNVTAGNQRVIGGFMPMVSNGCGVCYYVWNAELHFVITTNKGMGRSAKKFAKTLIGALNDMILLNSSSAESAYFSNL